MTYATKSSCFRPVLAANSWPCALSSSPSLGDAGLSPCSVAGCFLLFETQKLAFVSCLLYGDLNLLPSTMASPPPPGAGQPYCWEPRFLWCPSRSQTLLENNLKKSWEGKEEAVHGGNWGGVEWQRLHWSSVLQGSSGYLWFCLRRKKIYMKIKISKLIFPVTEKLI